MYLCLGSFVGVAKPRLWYDILQIYLQNEFISVPAGWSNEISYWCKTQILHIDFFSAIIELVSCSVHCYVLKIQSSFSRSFPVKHFLCPCSFPSLSLVSQTASVQRNKKTLTSLFFVSFDTNTVCLSVPMRELYWNSFLCEFLIAIHWWRLSRKGQIRTQSTRAATRGARLKIDFAIRSEKRFIWNLLCVI